MTEPQDSHESPTERLESAPAADATEVTEGEGTTERTWTSRFIWPAAALVAVALAIGVVVGYGAKSAKDAQLPAIEESSNYVATGRALQMYTLLSEQKFNEAYTFRSTGCKKVSEKDFVEAAKKLPRVERPKSVRITFSPDSKYAYIGTNSKDGTFDTGLTIRRWVVENGEWKFDNCE